MQRGPVCFNNFHQAISHCKFSTGVRAVYDVGTKPTSLVEDSVEVICTECLEPAFEPLDLEKTYEIITTQFITEGGDGYTMFKENRLSKFTYGECRVTTG